MISTPPSFNPAIRGSGLRVPSWLAGFTAVVLCLTTAIPHLVQAQDDYRIAPGDRITISVYGEPDLSFDDMPVPSSGFITYPFLGQIQAAGISEVELAGRITRGLLDGYLLQPQVSVAVIQYRPIYVGGAVRLPGQKDYSHWHGCGTIDCAGRRVVRTG